MTVLFFDLDATLMVNPFGKVIFPKVSQQLSELTGRSFDDIMVEILEVHDERMANPLEDRPRTMDWEDIFAFIAGRYGTTFDMSAEALVIEHAAPPHTTLLDDATTVLAELKAGGGRRLVVSSMGLSKYQFPVLKALGLYELFDDFLMPDLTGFLKTDADFYRSYAAEADLRLHVGDRYDHDCYYPMQFGSRSIMRLPLPELAAIDPFERPRLLPELRDKISGTLETMDCLPAAVIVTLAELPAVVEKLEADF
jgi:putative hydrolase of the HAD superfamily